MDSLPYIWIRFPRRQRHCHVTLSLPGGVERAIREGRLPDDAEALHLDLGAWVPLSEHPAVAPILGRRTAAPRWRNQLSAVERWAAAL